MLSLCEYNPAYVIEALKSTSRYLILIILFLTNG